MFDFLVIETKKGNFKYISAILNGDDYFGKFILRSILDIKVATRCDAGIGRFSLSTDNKIFVCPGAVDISDMVVGDLTKGIYDTKRQEFWSFLTNREYCGDCYARYICGGTCMVDSYYNKNYLKAEDNPLCKLNKHLYELSLLFKIIMKNSKHYKEIYSACITKNQRFKKDEDINYILRNSYDYLFNELKDLRYNNKREFSKILKQTGVDNENSV